MPDASRTTAATRAKSSPTPSATARRSTPMCGRRRLDSTRCNCAALVCESRCAPWKGSCDSCDLLRGLCCSRHHAAPATRRGLAAPPTHRATFQSERHSAEHFFSRVSPGNGDPAPHSPPFECQLCAVSSGQLRHLSRRYFETLWFLSSFIAIWEARGRPSRRAPALRVTVINAAALATGIGPDRHLRAAASPCAPSNGSFPTIKTH